MGRMPCHRFAEMGNCAKRTQFQAGPAVQTNPIGRSELCKTNPIPAGPGGTRPGERGTRDKCAKRTQFPAGPGGPPSPLPSRLCKAKPNLGKLGHLGTARRGPVVRNEPNFSIADFGLGPDLGCDAWLAACHPGAGWAAGGRNAQNEPDWPEQIMQNEPNSRLRREGRGPGDKGRGGKCAKRTQFGGVKCAKRSQRTVVGGR